MGFTAQSNSAFNEFLDQNYKNGHEDFLRTIYQSISYPSKARQSCRIGRLNTRIHINKNGQLEQIDFLNELGNGIEKEVLRVLSLTENNWTPSDTKRVYDFTFAFQIDATPEINGDIKVIANGVNKPPNCPSTEQLNEKLIKLIQKEKFKRAKKICDELLRREPESNHYRSLYLIIGENLND